MNARGYGITALALSCLVAPDCLTAQGDLPRRGVIRGALTDTAGHPISGAVTLTVDSSASVRSQRNGTTNYRDGAITEDDGRFHFDSLPPGVYTLSYWNYWTHAELRSLAIHGNDTLSVELRSKIRYKHVTPDSVRAQRLTELAAAKARWTARRLPQYRLTARIDCYCLAKMMGTPTLEFRGDSLISATDSSGRRREPPSWARMFAVSALFAAADSVLRDVEFFVAKIEYDPVYGVPTTIDTDNARGNTHSWFRQYVTDFRVIR
jgi:hypothetical protein